MTAPRVIEIILDDEGVFYDDPETGERLAVPCQWFGLCANAATRVMSHPIMGDVPICVRCEGKVLSL